MSERKFLVAAEATRHVEGGIGPRGTYANNEPYPVEVTVRRVAETVRFEANLEGYTDGANEWCLFVPQPPKGEALRGRGYVGGQRVRVTIEPLD